MRTLGGFGNNLAAAALLATLAHHPGGISDGPRGSGKPANPTPKQGKATKAEKKAAKRARTAARVTEIAE